ncbi:MAG: folate-binding protein YgfZ [Polyangiaceae bacterium]|nr:folate-binding protein YgfZ [Polyangiaceae bacterium]
MNEGPIDMESELDCAQMGAIVRPLSLGTIVVSGKDRVSWLNGMVTCEVAKKTSGDAAYGLIVSKAGKIQTELYALFGEEDVWLGVYESRAADIATELDRHLIMEEAELEVLEPAPAWLLALGPRAKAAAHAAREAGARAGLSTRGGLPAAIVAAPASALEATIDAITSSAAPSMIATPQGWERIRVEHGIPEFGIDFDDTNYPQEASLERDAVSFTKGCYLGQETVFMLENRGHVKKRLVQLLAVGDVSPGDKIALPDGTEIGKVTSRALRSPRQHLALGWVKYKQAKAETEVVIGDAKATVTHLLEVKGE